MRQSSPLLKDRTRSVPRESTRGLGQTKIYLRGLVWFCFLVTALCLPTRAQYSVDWSNIDGGGGTSTGSVYTRSVKNLGHDVSHQTAANLLKRHDLVPAPERGRTMSWRDFIRAHMEVLASVDFFTAEV